MTYNVISTGSKGNAVIINGCILIDCGVPFKSISAYKNTLKLVLLTHVHSDHFSKSTIKKLAEERPLLRFACCRWMVRPLLEVGVPANQIDVLESGTVYGYGLCNVIPFMVKHDVPNCGWKIWIDGEKLFYCTDMNNLNGISAQNYDLYMIEANYDENEILSKIAEKKVNGEFAYEKRVMRNHMSKSKANDWLYANMGNRSSYIYMHCHQEDNNEGTPD